MDNKLTTAAVTPSTLKALQTLSFLSNVSIVRIMETLVLPEYDAVMLGKKPSFIPVKPVSPEAKALWFKPEVYKALEDEK